MGNVVIDGVYVTVHSFLNDFIMPKFARILDNTNIQVILIPSLNDICFDRVFPQPDFTQAIKKGFLRENQNFHCFSNPCMFSINDVKIGISTNDILSDLIPVSLKKNDQVSVSGICKAAEQLILQHSFYPLYPGGKDSAIELTKINELTMTSQPDLLLLSSKLNKLVYHFNGSIIVNSNSLVKGNSGGMFAKVVIHPNKLTKNDGIFSYFISL